MLKSGNVAAETESSFCRCSSYAGLSTINNLVKISKAIEFIVNRTAAVGNRGFSISIRNFYDPYSPWIRRRAYKDR